MKKLILPSIALIFTLFFFSAEDTKVQAQALLDKGSSGQDVYDVQAKLSRMGYLNVSPTGDFGSLTERAVKDFQFENNLVVDGVVGTGVQDQLDNIDMMAKVVHGEARGEPYDGKVGVAAVILNRVDSSEFPSTVQQVIFQDNAFTAVHDGQYDLTPDKGAYEAVIQAVNGDDPTNGATYYYNPSTATDEWIFTRDSIVDIGKHTFAS